MKLKTQYNIAFLLLIVGLQSAVAQKKDENIGTEVINVVKPYTPTISDAFKIKETPVLEDEDNSKKEEIKYSIFSFPVASTFTPSKGKAAGVDKSKEEKLYKNYFTAGLGNYFTAFAELYVTENLGDTDYVAGMLKHLSSNGGIKDIPVRDGYLNTALDLTYGSKQKDFSWNADLGYQIQKYHWYGLPSEYETLLTPDQKTAVYNGIDEGQTYSNFYLGGKIKFSESVFKEVSLKYNRFWDGFSSSENRFTAKPSFQFDVQDKTIKTNVIVDYLGGTFAKDYFGTNAIKYGFTNFGIHPSFAMQKNDWSFNIGASVFYSLDTEQSNNKLFVYPQINASLKVVGDLMIFYAGAEGGLEQNSYRDFTNENPFVSPTLGINPTDKQYDLFAGLKGKLSNYISYNIKGSLVSEKNKALFKSNINDKTVLVKDQYRYGNSFGIVYDNVKTVRLFGELKADFSKNISFGINGEFNSFSTAFQEEAWNLPSLKIGANLDVNITQKWYAGADVFFVGQRKDSYQVIQMSLVPITPVTRTLASYFDANAHLGYKYNERFTAFLRLNNVANQGYQKWMNYPVQSFQIMIGGNYKFDF